MQARARKQDGQAATETALVLPVLLLLVLGAVALAYLLFSSMVAVFAAHQAGRLGAVLYGDPAVQESDAEQRTKQAALRHLNILAGTDHEVSVSRQDEDVEVTVRYRMPVFVPWLGRIFGEDRITVRHTAVYRVELK